MTQQKKCLSCKFFNLLYTPIDGIDGVCEAFTSYPPGLGKSILLRDSEENACRKHMEE